MTTRYARSSVAHFMGSRSNSCAPMGLTPQALRFRYYTQWKVTDDRLPNVPPGFISKHRYYGIGPEINGVIPISAKTLTIFKLAFFHELGNRVATQGNSIIMSVTLAKPHH